jgi:hypothetical protein
VLDASEMLARWEFVYADCIWRDGRFIAFEIVGDRVVLDPQAAVDLSNSTDVFPNFTVDIDGATYVGGEASSHGSCGFFFKRVGERLDWMVVSTLSEPFVGVEREGSRLRFRTQLGDRWIVDGDSLDRITIERA